MLRRSFTVINQADELIRGDIRHREDVKSAPAIVLCHGFKGFKDWGFFPYTAEILAEAGYIAVSFNFSRNGIGSDPLNFTELNKFARNSYSHEIEDLRVIIDSIKNGTLGRGLIEPDRIGILGHSRGGGIAVLYTQEDNAIAAMVTWAAIAEIDRFRPDVMAEWKKKGYIELENKRTKQMMRIEEPLYLDITQNKDRLDIAAAAKNIEIPALILHGDVDESVPPAEGRKIFDALGSVDKEYIRIEGGTHTFGIAHPMLSRTEQFEAVLDLTENWFDRYLNL